ncbi:hypothetical protein QBC34DRAFT_460440 [Podospora aff. communis PSN243]|uniref:Uncharacterized protein n=1 Tax=Podospora aff. communis PSN243 TaxID=3040156 RepID=A0AAV9H609_9PEZI|nr:hypothetical protein QBC34DRAFT_460440 [Podospora aff. communis PSN243]
MVLSLPKPHNQSLFRLLRHQESTPVRYTSNLPKPTLRPSNRITNHLRPQLQLPRPTSQAPSFPARSLRTATTPRFFSTTAPRTMASDEDYMAFLNKANKDPSEGYEQQATTKNSGREPFKTTDSGVEVPKVLLKVTRDKFYVSDADEPWEAVGLGWDEGGRGLPDEEEFATLIGHWAPKEAEIEIMDPVDWDRNGQYKDVIDAVREAGAGNDVRVYRVGRGGVKAEYWVVTTEGKGKGAKLVGVKALAVES